MASSAETRIRNKAEHMLRDLFPEARIVHEFDLCGSRLDLAAITPERLVLVEIKSEKDTLTRLANQARMSLRLGGPFLVCAASKWRADLAKYGVGEMSWHRAERLIETDEGFEDVYETARYPSYWRTRLKDSSGDRYDSRALLNLLLKPELLALARPFGAKVRYDVGTVAQIVHENLNGREVRIGVLAALRARRFGWTCDAPITNAVREVAS